MAAPHADPVTAAHGGRVRTRALLILNRKARYGRADHGAALERLAQAGYELIESRVEQPNQLSPVIRQAAGQVDAVIIGGGDGTLTMAADGLVDAQLPVGVLPMGTANDLARTLGLPTDLVAAAEVIAQGILRRIDLGWVNGTHFFNAATVGFGAGITRRLNRKLKSRWGVLAYPFAAAGVVVRARPFSADLVTAAETIRVRTAQVTVANGRHYGGGLTIDESADIDDGLLHLISLEVKHWWQVLPLLRRLVKGKFSGSTLVRTISGQQFEVRPVKRRRIKITADGEISGRTPAVFRIVPQALSVFVPA